MIKYISQIKLFDVYAPYNQPQKDIILNYIVYMLL